MSEKEWNKLGAYLKETQILGSIQSTLYWDQNTGMPNKGASWRSEQLTYIAKILHKRNSSEEFSDLIKAAQDEFRDGLEKSLNQEIIRSKKRNLELLIKEFNRIYNTFVQMLSRYTRIDAGKCDQICDFGGTMSNTFPKK